ncbi:hypothetical protein TNCV_4413601 [Trichonephila clavipes]|nr:hypothetical protein TNCV_4413601 [Trichonephila clavipes]
MTLAEIIEGGAAADGRAGVYLRTNRNGRPDCADNVVTNGSVEVGYPSTGQNETSGFHICIENGILDRNFQNNAKVEQAVQ